MNQPRARRVVLPGRGGEMACLYFGPPGRPVDVVFSHANGFNARTYRTVLAPLGELRILAVDLRGHGRSTLPADTEGWPGWSAYADDLIAFSAEGAGSLIGDARIGANPVCPRFGIATALVRAGTTPGRIRIRAEAFGLQTGEVIIETETATGKRL